MIGLIVALSREIPTGFVQAASGDAREALSFPLYHCTSASRQLVAVQTGVGPSRAAAGARFLVQHCSIQGLVSCGFAGGLLPGLASGTVVVGDRLVSTDGLLSWDVTDHRLVEQILQAAQAEGLPVHQGPVVTTAYLVPDRPSKAALAHDSGASVVDMETRGVVEVARQAGLAWVAVRAIVDTLDEVLPAECLTILRDDGRIAGRQLPRKLWRSPAMMQDFLWLAWRTAMARRHLSRLMHRWAQESMEAQS